MNRTLRKVVSWGLLERMMGLEPTTFCVATPSSVEALGSTRRHSPFVARPRVVEGPSHPAEGPQCAGGASAQKAALMKTSVGFGFGKTVSLPGDARVNKGRNAVPCESRPW